MDKKAVDPTLSSFPFIISSEEHKSVLIIATEYKILLALLDSFFYQRDLYSYFNDLKTSFIKPLECKLKIIFKQENNDRIKAFISQRVDNVKDAPSKMIDSCLERSRKTIILDRILINKPNSDPYLELDPKKLKKATALHFQTVAGSLNKIVTDPMIPDFSNFWTQWEEYYCPLPHINNNIYDHILDASTYDE